MNAYNQEKISSGNPTLESLTEFRERNERPAKIGFFYTGGTFACFNTPQGLRPVKTKEEIDRLLDGLGIGLLKKKELLEPRVHFLFSMDSTNVQPEHRDKMVKQIMPHYSEYDGVIVVHGTDTGTESAKHLQLAMPYFNPLGANSANRFNWTKPAILLSSQLPAVVSGLEDRKSVV